MGKKGDQGVKDGATRDAKTHFDHLFSTQSFDIIPPDFGLARNGRSQILAWMVEDARCAGCMHRRV